MRTLRPDLSNLPYLAGRLFLGAGAPGSLPLVNGHGGRGLFNRPLNDEAGRVGSLLRGKLTRRRGERGVNSEAGRVGGLLLAHLFNLGGQATLVLNGGAFLFGTHS